MIIEVTQEDIDQGYRKSPTTCPVALALKRKYNIFCSIKEQNICLGNEIILTPPKVIRFIENFDAGFQVEPFTFEIQNAKTSRTFKS